MPAHIFGNRDLLQFEIGPKDPQSFSMRRVDIYAVDTHVTARDNSVYVPSFIFLLDRALKSFRKGTRFQQRPDIFDELGPRDIHRILADDPDQYPDTGELPDLWGFLEFGDITLQVLSFLIPTRGHLYLTCETSQHGDAKEREVRIAEVSVEALTKAMTATLEVVAAEYEGDKSSLS
ncbi:hypothetical protein J7E49_04530 [Variovorax paradoxus]|nr:hypothetical protein [Variovorax paradoxus]